MPLLPAFDALFSKKKMDARDLFALNEVIFNLPKEETVDETTAAKLFSLLTRIAEPRLAGDYDEHDASAFCDYVSLLGTMQNQHFFNLQQIRQLHLWLMQALKPVGVEAWPCRRRQCGALSVTGQPGYCSMECWIEDEDRAVGDFHSSELCDAMDNSGLWWSARVCARRFRGLLHDVFDVEVADQKLYTIWHGVEHTRLRRLHGLANVVSQDHIYAALDGAHPLSAFQGTQDEFIEMPRGWELAPAEPRILEDIIAAHPWGAQGLVTADGRAWSTSSGLKAGQLLRENALMNHGRKYRPSAWCLRVLIRRVADPATWGRQVVHAAVKASQSAVRPEPVGCHTLSREPSPLECSTVGGQDSAALKKQCVVSAQPLGPLLVRGSP